jgi:hypothetical protein
MAVDKKYGRVTLEHGDIGDDEPVIVFRARDGLVPKLLAYYALFCMKAGSPRFHVDIVLDRREDFLAWQAANPDLVRVPSSTGYQERVTGGAA